MVVRQVLSLIGLARRRTAKDLKIAVLRHQLLALVLAAAVAAVPRAPVSRRLPCRV
jgi:hypothetical protein